MMYKLEGLLLVVVLLASGILGFIVPPSSMYDDVYGWDRFAENASFWYRELGWIDDDSAVVGNVSFVYSVFNCSYFIFNIAHGGSMYFMVNDTFVHARRVIPDRRLPYEFVFLASCGAFDVVDVSGSWEQELEDTGCRVMVGYSGMGSNTRCWRRAYHWQNTFFQRLHNGATFGEAYDYAIDAYPVCNGTIVIYGDTSLYASDLSPCPFDLNGNARIDLIEVQSCIDYWINT